MTKNQMSFLLVSFCGDCLVPGISFPNFKQKKSFSFFFILICSLHYEESHATRDLNGENDDEFGEYAFLKEENGKFFPPPKQREVIRKVCLFYFFFFFLCKHHDSSYKCFLKGGRPPIHKQCPSALASVIRECWETLPEKRPPFPVILDHLVEIYVAECMICVRYYITEYRY